MLSVFKRSVDIICSGLGLGLDSMYVVITHFTCYQCNMAMHFEKFTHSETFFKVCQIWTNLRYVNRQLLRQFWSDQFISKLSITVAVYQQTKIIQCKQNSMQHRNHTHILIETRFTRDYILWWKDLQQEMFKMFSFY